MLNNKFINVMYIDLETKKTNIKKRPDLIEYLGGVGVATKLLDENLNPKLDALDPSQPIIFAIGPMNTIFPVVTKTVSMFKSPMTGELGESYAGGRFGFSMLMAGIDAIVITGKSEKPVYLSINNKIVNIKDARALWGVSQEECVRAMRDSEPGPGKRSIIRIGKAGENLVRYSSVTVDTYRHFGRLGLGALFGSKNLKAISITGNSENKIEDLPKYLKEYQNIYKKVIDTGVMEKYHELGTSVNVLKMSNTGALPTKNLLENSFECAENISGETFAKDHLIRKMSCVGCPIGCIHIGEIKREFDKGYEYETINVAYDHEPIFAVGSFLGTKTSEEVIMLIDAIEKAGVDVMSTGVILGWATEAFNKGIIGLDQTIVPLVFGDTQNYINAIQYISQRENEFYENLGYGLKVASGIYGGEDYAMVLGGNEMAGYHTGYGMMLGQALGARHSHLCNGGYSFDQTLDEFDGDKLIDSILKEELERCVLNCLCVCLFARRVYDRETTIKALNSIGIIYDNEKLDELGLKIYKLKQKLKKDMGFDHGEIKFPKRMFETASLTGKLDENKLNKLKELFIKRINEITNDRR